MLKAVIFDMDGVLINSEPLHYEVDRLLIEELGHELDYEYYKQFIGSTNTHLWTSIKAKFKLKETVSQLHDMADKKKRELLEKNGYPVINGVFDMVKRLYESGLNLAVASSSPPAYIKEVTEALGIASFFTHLVSGETVENPKPAPDVFLKAAQLLETDSTDCLVIEDSSNGARAAKRAGMVCIGYINDDSGQQDLSMADYLIEGYDSVDRTFLEMVHSHATGNS